MKWSPTRNVRWENMQIAELFLSNFSFWKVRTYPMNSYGRTPLRSNCCFPHFCLGEQYMFWGYLVKTFICSKKKLIFILAFKNGLLNFAIIYIKEWFFIVCFKFILFLYLFIHLLFNGDLLCNFYMLRICLGTVDTIVSNAYPPSS